MTWGAVHTSKSIHSSLKTSTTPFLPFLYQTSTILQSWRRNASTVPREGQRSPRTREKPQKRTAVGSSSRPPGPFQRMPILSNPFENDPRRVRTSEPKRVKSVDDPPLADSDLNTSANVFKKILEDSSKRSTDRSTIARRHAVTMTQAEHEIFERLQALSGKTKPSSLADTEAADEFDDPESGTDTLKDLFNKIAGRFEKEELREQQKPQKSLKIHMAKQKQLQETRQQTHRALLESIAWPQLESTEPVQHRLTSPDSGEKDMQTLQSDGIKHTKEIQKRFSTIETDRDLWNILDQHVFKTMRGLQELSKSQQIELDKQNQPTVKKSNSFRKRKKTTKAREPSKPSQADLDSEKALMQKMMNTYGPAILYATRLFRTGFSSSSYANLILPTIKSLGPISYVLAASTSLYDELLYIRWETYRDLNGCADLIDEMISQNLLADRHTALVYKAAKETRDYELGITKQKRTPLSSNKQDEFDAVATGIISAPELDWNLMSTKYIPFGTPVKSFQEGFWRLQGVEAAWLRLTTSYSRLVTITRQEIQRKRNEQIFAEERIVAVSDTTDGQADPINALGIGKSPGEDTDVEPEIEILHDEDLNEPRMLVSSL